MPAREYKGSRFDHTFVSGTWDRVGWWTGTRKRALLASVQRRWSASAPDYDALAAELRPDTGSAGG